MATSALDSFILRNIWGTEELYAIFNDRQIIQNWLDYEVALAQVQAELKIIPEAAATEIERNCSVDKLDFDLVAQNMKKVKHRMVSVLKTVEQSCANGHGEWIHFGATTQDVLDTATVVALKQVHEIIKRDLSAVAGKICRMAEKHRNTPMVGRTHAVHALPITFGHKCAIWLRELSRHHERLIDVQKRVFVGSFVGAVGTQASLGPIAHEVEARLMQRLGLMQADISWAPARDRFAEYAALLGLISGTINKIGNEIYLLQRDEIGEFAEGFTLGKMGSSTMPHKRNPTALENINASAKVLRHNVSLMMEAMVHENERDSVAWKLEWKALPEICVMAGGMLAQLDQVLGSLVVNTDVMRRNLGLMGSMLLSERLMFALAPKLGKQTAHELVYEAAMQARSQNKPFEETLAEYDQIRAVLSPDELDALMDPTTYVGVAPEVVDRVVAATRAEGWLAE